MKPYLIILPALNEERSVASVIEGIRKAAVNADILIVNDGSKDRTREMAEGLGAMVISHPNNLGYGAALQTGFRFAVKRGYESVVTMDADGQHDPLSITALFRQLESSDADVVIGSRFLEGTYTMSFARRAGAWIFARAARFHTGYRFTDPTSGFQLLRHRAFSYLARSDAYPLDYPDVNIIILLHKKRFKVVEAPVRMLSNAYGNTMHSGLKPVLYVFRMLLAIAVILMQKED